MDDVQKSPFQKAFLISFIYVGVGTLCLFSMFADSPLYGDWAFIGGLITLPVTFISFGLLYMEPDRISLALLIQFLTFCSMWFLVYRSLNKSK